MMRRKYLILCILAALALFSCNRKSNLKFGMMGCYTMEGGEKELPADKESLKQYDNELRVANIQSFINKLTGSKQGKKYFSIVLEDLPDKIITKIKSDSTLTIIEETSKEANETTYFFYKAKEQNGLLLVKVLFKQPKLTNSIIVDAVFNNEDDWNTFFAEREKFIEKFNCDYEKP